MSRIEDKFMVLKKKGRKALITFVTAGDPDLAVTEALVLEMEKQGADIIELGVPYSDPIAEGPVIQVANVRALKNSVRLPDLFALVSRLRQKTDVPLLFLLYYNSILQYGSERFFAEGRNAGLDGLIVPDLPFEERGELGDLPARHGIDLIRMISPVSEERIDRIVRGATGFLYCVSSLGVTGVREGFSTDFEDFFSKIRRHSSLPTALGFGISTPDHVRSLKAYADGLIVGSAIVRRVGESASPAQALEKVGGFVRELRKAMDS
ncbi:MAG: tryptophan synthase subunit alpha [Fibrobacterota bacterium]